jgi:hypothetical protein
MLKQSAATVLAMVLHRQIPHPRPQQQQQQRSYAQACTKFVHCNNFDYGNAPPNSSTTTATILRTSTKSVRWIKIGRGTRQLNSSVARAIAKIFHYKSYRSRITINRSYPQPFFIYAWYPIGVWQDAFVFCLQSQSVWRYAFAFSIRLFATAIDSTTKIVHYKSYRSRITIP